MKLKEVVDQLGLQVVTGDNNLDVDVTGGYASDLLSDVMAHANPGNLWVTLQIHQNIIAVAVLKEVAAIVLVAGRQPNDDAVEKAKQEDIPVLISDLPAFDLIGRMHELGIGGTRP